MAANFDAIPQKPVLSAIDLCATGKGTRDFLGSIPSSFFDHHKQQGPSQDERQQGDILDILDEQNASEAIDALYR